MQTYVEDRCLQGNTADFIFIFLSGVEREVVLITATQTKLQTGDGLFKNEGKASEGERKNVADLFLSGLCHLE